MLKSAHVGAPLAILDLDVLDENARLISQKLGSRFALRLVTKSIPSLPLIEHTMAVTGSRRLMAFTEGLLGELLSMPGPPVDILLGKPLPVEAAGRLLVSHARAHEVQWLLDTPARALQYAALARESGVTLRCSIEIDVGLRRGGARTGEELRAILEVIQASQGSLELSGFMGYDGHLPYVPALLDKEAAIQAALRKVLEAYGRAVRSGQTWIPTLFSGPLVFDSGGSRTFFRYGNAGETPINELSVGSAFLAPRNFPELAALGHRPALFLATPVLKKDTAGEVPFLERTSGILSSWDPNLSVAYGLMGGGWTADPVQPPGLGPHFLLESGGGVESLLSNQRVLFGSSQVSLEVGDFVFFWPWEGDAMLTFDRMLVVRGQERVGWWPTFRGGSG